MNPRIAIVDKNRCHPTRCNHECIKHDPINKSGGEGFHIGEDGKAAIAEEVTIEAHSISAKKCPFGAIKIVKLPEELTSSPLHRYGENGFRVFNMPTPLPKKVVGLLGRNGIGKTTVLQILSNQLHPNLGRVGEHPDIKEIIDVFKGSETQRYFEHIRDGKMTFAYKPQAIEVIPKHFKGTIRELLREVSGDDQQVSDVITKLGLDVVIDRDISTISGGELQRAAIAATALKKADVYFFDEPTSFLDIYQRLAVSTFIRDLAEQGASVVVIEHDLIILDAVTDIIHIVYGEEGAYGVIAGPKSTKAGINMYLQGFLPQENIRFRPYEISFKKGQEAKAARPDTLVSWPKLTKKLGDFSLACEPGELYKHEVVGILGQNGIGKTTFINMLAGKIAPDTGKIDQDIKISFKPQYLDSKNEELVMVYIEEAIKKYDLQIIKPLNLRPLFEKPLNELSGGQLQRVMIAACLSQDADLFLLDEPSAYLDAEQRLQVSKVIKDFMMVTGKTAIVVDHDLLFLDYFSTRLFVFSGVPGSSGKSTGPHSMQEGMNQFLQQVDLTFRRDDETERPRANKPGSQMDQKQKAEGIWYYV